MCPQRYEFLSVCVLTMQIYNSILNKYNYIIIKPSIQVSFTIIVMKYNFKIDTIIRSKMAATTLSFKTCSWNSQIKTSMAIVFISITQANNYNEEMVTFI